MKKPAEAGFAGGLTGNQAIVRTSKAFSSESPNMR